MDSGKRNPAADIIRILAFFSVVSVHFFLNNGYYSYTVDGKRMYIMTVIRSFFIICVPLFLTLSGYLLRKKRLEKKYYARIGKIVITYVLASLTCILYSAVCLGKDYSIPGIIRNILNFSAAPYSWYIEMYLGLFLLIPFLNIVYNALPSQKSKIWLIISFVILTSLPSVLNIYNFEVAGWWAQPSAVTATNKLVPVWWQSLYPITYYYIGCYLSEYGLKINRFLNAGLIVLWTVISGTFCFWRTCKSEFIWGSWCGYQSLFNVVLTVLVFAFFINANYDKMPRWWARFIQSVSGLSLGAYLVSWIFDSEFYPVLLEKVPVMPLRLEYYIIIVPTIFVLSLLVSFFLGKMQWLIEKIFSLICRIFKKKAQ